MTMSDVPPPSPQPAVPTGERPLVQWRAVLVGALVGLGILVALSVISAVLDHYLDDFDDSGWIYPLFVGVLVGYAVGGFVGGPRQSRRGPHQRNPCRARRLRALGSRPDRHLGRPRRGQGVVHRPFGGPASGSDLRAPRHRVGARHVRRLARSAGGGTREASTGSVGLTVARNLATGSEPAGRPRAGPKGTGPRNVRTPQGTVLGNTQSGRPAGKCNREQTADGTGSPVHR